MTNKLKIFLMAVVLVLALGIGSAAADDRMAAAGFVPVAAGATAGPLLIAVPDGWELGYKGTDGMNFYVLQGSKASQFVMMLSIWPPGGSPAKVPGLVDQVAGSMAGAAKSDARLAKMDPNYTKGEIKGSVFAGEYAVFKITDGQTQMVQTLYFINDGQTMWNGQFTGSASQWTQALNVLSTLKKN